MWSQNWTRNIRRGVFGIAKNLKITCFAFFKYLGMPPTPLLRVLVQFWDHFITDFLSYYFWKKVSDLHYDHQKVPFQGYSIFGRISDCNPYCKFNLKFRPWRSWATMLNFFVADQCTKRHNKNSQPTCLDSFDKNWHTLMSHDISSSQLLELVTWHFGPMFTNPWALHVTFHLSCDRCQGSGVTCNKVKKEIWRGLSVEGLVSTGYNLNSAKKNGGLNTFFRFLNFGPLKSYFTNVQNGPIQKLPHGCPKWGGGGRGHFWTISKKKTFFWMASLTRRPVFNRYRYVLQIFSLLNWIYGLQWSFWDPLLINPPRNELFLVHPTVVSVLLSASVERCFVSRMRDFFLRDC